MERVLAEQHIRRRASGRRGTAPHLGRQYGMNDRVGAGTRSSRPRVGRTRLKTIGLLTIALVLISALFLLLPLLEKTDFASSVADETVTRAAISGSIAPIPPRQVEFELTEELFYQVDAGETLSEIAAAFDLDARTLARHNGLSDPHALQAGQIIRIPPGGELPQTEG